MLCTPRDFFSDSMFPDSLASPKLRRHSVVGFHINPILSTKMVRRIAPLSLASWHETHHELNFMIECRPSNSPCIHQVEAPFSFVYSTEGLVSDGGIDRELQQTIVLCIECLLRSNPRGLKTQVVVKQLRYVQIMKLCTSATPDDHLIKDLSHRTAKLRSPKTWHTNPSPQSSTEPQ